MILVDLLTGAIIGLCMLGFGALWGEVMRRGGY